MDKLSHPFLDEKIIEDLKKQARNADKEDREKALLMGELIKSPGWKAYVEMLSKKQQFFADALLMPSGSIDGCIRQEWVKGALSGLVVARDLPSVTIEAARALPRHDEDT